VNVHIKPAQLAKIFMSSHCASVGSTQHPNWRDLYLQALFETNKERASTFITEAEKALVHRECELFADPHSAAELEAVNTALHALLALRSCLGMRTPALAA
jgi:hypothetical protein